MMIDFLRTRAKSFRYAIAGWWYVVKTQKNAWIHAIATLLVYGFAFGLNLPARDIAVLTLTIGLVWTSEFINTALEAVVDLASPHQHPLAKVGKDVGAAAVLISSLASAIIGFLILGPPLYSYITQFINR
jgi:diacylglycerol kinase